MLRMFPTPCLGCQLLASRKILHLKPFKVLDVGSPRPSTARFQPIKLRHLQPSKKYLAGMATVTADCSLQCSLPVSPCPYLACSIPWHQSSVCNNDNRLLVQGRFSRSKFSSPRPTKAQLAGKATAATNRSLQCRPPCAT
jgi:hypothetical protein